MLPITGADIISFYNSGRDLLAVYPNGILAHLDSADVKIRDGYHVAKREYVTTPDGQKEIFVLLDRSVIEGAPGFREALDDTGALRPSDADDIAQFILDDRVLAVEDATLGWQRSVETANANALKRARAVAMVVACCGNNQSEASRRLNMDQSTVNKLVKKAKAAECQ